MGNVSRCCPAASSFDWLHETYYSPYAVEGCVLRREGRMPISWHGDGLGKWTYLLALTDLAFNCHRIARLVITNHPTDMLDHLFSSLLPRRSLARPSLTCRIMST